MDMLGTSVLSIVQREVVRSSEVEMYGQYMQGANREVAYSSECLLSEVPLYVCY